MDDLRVGKRDVYRAGLAIAFYLALIGTVALFLATSCFILMVEEGQALRLWCLIAASGGTLLSLALAWGLQGRIIEECRRQA